MKMCSMCGVVRGKHKLYDFIQIEITLQSGFNLQILILKWNPSKAIQIGVIYEDFKRLTMSSPSFAKSVKYAIIMQEKSGLMEKWPLDTKEEHKRTTDKSREFELCDALTMQKCD